MLIHACMIYLYMHHIAYKSILTNYNIIYTLHQASEAIKFGAEMLGSTPPDSGIYEINHVCGEEPHIFHTSVPAMQARCSDGGWTVILRRKANVPQQVNFTRTWSDYKHGFGDLNTEFWYGLRNIHCLTSRQEVVLRIELKYGSGSEQIYNYKYFKVDGPEDKYTLRIGQLQQPSPGFDAMAYSNRRPFTTYDRDNDASSSNCALNNGYGNGGGWWFGSCSHSVLTTPHTKIYWNPISRSAINHVEMKVRPKHCAK